MALNLDSFGAYPCKVILLLCLLACLVGCQKRPAWAPSADNLSAIEPPPMGASTYNDELKRELNLLDEVLNGRIPEDKLKRLKEALINGHTKDLSKDPTSNEAHLVKIFLTLPELVHGKSEFNNRDKKWLTAKFYFLNRRFVESATLMSEMLQVENDDLVRNWRARAIFFLGNPDLAVKELKAIIAHSTEQSAAGLDALYLIGAISYESNDQDAQRITTGIDAWTRYLKLATADPQMTNEINDGLNKLRQRLKGEEVASVDVAFDPFAENKKYDAEKNAILRVFAKDELLLALELCEQALKKSYDSDVATIKARILFKTGRIEEASLLFTDIVEKAPNYAPGFHYRGMAFMLQGRPKDAISSWQRTLEIDERYGNFHGLKQRMAVAQKMVQPTVIEKH